MILILGCYDLVFRPAYCTTASSGYRRLHSENRVFGYIMYTYAKEPQIPLVLIIPI